MELFMNENYSVEYEENSKSEIYWLYVFLYIIGAMVIGGITYLMCGNNGYTFIKNSEPNFAMSFSGITWCTMFGLDLLGIASFFMWLSKYTDSRPKKEILENFIPLIIHLVLIMLWALFSFGLLLPIVGCCILGVSIVVAIYMTYRYYNSSIIAGILSTIWTLWLMYVFILNLAYCLL